MTSEHEISRATAAISWIDSLKDRIRLMLIEGAYTYDLGVSKQDTAEALLAMQDILDDLFARDRRQLVAVAGESLHGEIFHGKSAKEILDERTKAEVNAVNRVQHERVISIKPLTREEACERTYGEKLLEAQNRVTATAFSTSGGGAVVREWE